MSTFSGLEIGRKAMQAQQKALQVTSHNIANANTKGFSRQVVTMLPTTPYTLPGLGRPEAAGQMGTGVTVDRITRMRNTFLDGQYRNEVKSLGRWEVRLEAMEEVEVIINELADYGLGSVLEDFREAFQQLSFNPESMELRTLVLQSASAVTDSFRHIDRQLTDLQNNADEAINQTVIQTNDMIERIHSLNQLIIAVRAAGDTPNDLNDQRDLLLDEMTKIVNIQITEDSQTGSVQVSIGGKQVINNYGMVKLTTVEGADNLRSVVWADNGETAAFGSIIRDGQLKGYQEVRDEIVGSYQSNINQLATEFVSIFNRMHGEGYDLVGNNDPARYFFIISNPAQAAGSLRVNPLLTSDPKLIAASGGPTGGGSNALALSRWMQGLDAAGEPIPATHPDHLVANDYLRQMVTEMGIEGDQALKMVENQESLLVLIDNQRTSVSGVDIDEEMANMIRYQQAYNAAARMVTAIDEMLDTIINRLGIVGR